MDKRKQIRKSIEMFATQIASGIVQNQKLVEEFKAMADVAKKDGEKYTEAQFVACVSVETAKYIILYTDYYMNQLDEGEKK